MSLKDTPVNHLLCSTYKNKTDKNQCPNKRKNNLLFCGKHKNEQEIIAFCSDTINNAKLNNITSSLNQN